MVLRLRGFRCYHSGFQTQGYHIGVAKLPSLLPGSPDTARGLDPFSGFGFPVVHPDGKGVVGGVERLPSNPLDYSPYLPSPTPRWSSMASTKMAAHNSGDSINNSWPWRLSAAHSTADPDQRSACVGYWPQSDRRQGAARAAQAAIKPRATMPKVFVGLGSP